MRAGKQRTSAPDNRQGELFRTCASFQSFIEQITDLIASRPGIRNIEIAEELDIDADVVRPIIKSRIENSRIIVEKVQSLAGLMNAYRINSRWTPADEHFIPLRSPSEPDPDVPMKKPVGRPRKHARKTDAEKKSRPPPKKRVALRGWQRHMRVSDGSAEKVIAAFDGIRPTARALGRNPSTVHRWNKSREEGGNGGRVPRELISLILEIAAKTGIRITKADLIEQEESK